MNSTKVIYLYDYSRLPVLYTPPQPEPSSRGFSPWFEPSLNLEEARRAYAQAEYQPIGDVASSTHIRQRTRNRWVERIGIALIAVAIGGLLAPLSPMLRLEGLYYASKAKEAVLGTVKDFKPLPPSVPVIFEPLTTPDGASIEPVSQEFSVIIPKVGINAKVVANVDPGKPKEYMEALETGVAHAKTSFLPDENGTVYLFSHSTNYDWFVKDLNAVFYHLKNLEAGDTIVVIYEGRRFTYKLTDKKVVKPKDITYLVPNSGKNSLILQTCWPPGSVAERLLLFADLVEERVHKI